MISEIVTIAHTHTHFDFVFLIFYLFKIWDLTNNSKYFDFVLEKFFVRIGEFIEKFKPFVDKRLSNSKLNAKFNASYYAKIPFQYKYNKNFKKYPIKTNVFSKIKINIEKR